MVIRLNSVMDDREDFKREEGWERRKRLRRSHLQVELSSQVKAEINGRLLQAESTKNPRKKAKYVSLISQLEATHKVEDSPNPTLMVNEYSASIIYQGQENFALPLQMNLDPLVEASHVGSAVIDTSDNLSRSQMIPELMSQELYMMKPISEYQQGSRAMQLWQDNYYPLPVVVSVMIGIMNESNEESPWLQASAVLVTFAGAALGATVLLPPEQSKRSSKAKQFFQDVETLTISVALICILVMICGLMLWKPFVAAVHCTLCFKWMRYTLTKRRAMQRRPHAYRENGHTHDHGIIMILGMATLWTQDDSGITEKGGEDIRVAATVAAALSMLYPQVARWWPKLPQYIHDSDLAAAAFLLFFASGFDPCGKILKNINPFILFLSGCVCLFLGLCFLCISWLSRHRGVRRKKLAQIEDYCHKIPSVERGS